MRKRERTLNTSIILTLMSTNSIKMKQYKDCFAFNKKINKSGVFFPKIQNKMNVLNFDH